MKNLPGHISLHHLQKELEILAGLVSGTYELYFGSKLIKQDEELVFNKNIHTGCLLTVTLFKNFREIFEAIHQDSLCAFKKTLKEIHFRDEILSKVDNFIPIESQTNPLANIIFVSLYRCLFSKANSIFRHLIHDNNEFSKKECTSFKRTLVHGAASSDNTDALKILYKNGHKMDAKDTFGETPLKISQELKTCSASRFLRTISLTKNKSEHEHEESRRCFSESNRSFKNLHQAGTIIEIPRSPQKYTNNKDLVIEHVKLSNESSFNKYTPPDYHSFISRVNEPPTKTAFDIVNLPKEISKDDQRNASSRSFSKKYYQTKFHKMKKNESTYQARPATAGPRFRYWKTWLIDENKEKNTRSHSNEANEKKLRNEICYDNWLERKQNNRSRLISNSDSNHSDEEYEIDYMKKFTFESWLNSKQSYFSKMARLKGGSYDNIVDYVSDEEQINTYFSSGKQASRYIKKRIEETYDNENQSHRYLNKRSQNNNKKQRIKLVIEAVGATNKLKLDSNDIPLIYE